MSRVPSEPLSAEDQQKIAAIQVKAMIQREKDLKNQPFAGPTRIKGRDYKTAPMVVWDWTAYIGLHGVAVVGVFFLYFFLIVLNTAVVLFVQSYIVVMSIMAPSAIMAIWLWRTRRIPRSHKEKRLWTEIEILKRGGHFNGVAENRQKLAEGGNLIAMLQLAELFDAGRGVARNPRRAFDFVHHAARRGHVASQFALGERYLNGLGVTVDIDRAMQWFKSAADHGLPAAAMTLGYLCEHPRRNSEPDLDAASRWYAQAVDGFILAKRMDDARAALVALRNVSTKASELAQLENRINQAQGSI